MDPGKLRMRSYESRFIKTMWHHHIAHIYVPYLLVSPLTVRSRVTLQTQDAIFYFCCISTSRVNRSCVQWNRWYVWEPYIVIVPDIKNTVKPSRHNMSCWVCLVQLFLRPIQHSPMFFSSHDLYVKIVPTSPLSCAAGIWHVSWN